MVKKFLVDVVILVNKILGSGFLYDKFLYNLVMVCIF